jgi:hypothetical protein
VSYVLHGTFGYLTPWVPLRFTSMVDMQEVMQKISLLESESFW